MSDEKIIFGKDLFSWTSRAINLIDSSVRVNEKLQNGICSISLYKRLESGKFATLDPFIRGGARVPFKESDLLKAVEEAVPELNKAIQK